MRIQITHIAHRRTLATLELPRDYLFVMTLSGPNWPRRKSIGSAVSISARPDNCSTEATDTTTTTDASFAGLNDDILSLIFSFSHSPVFGRGREEIRTYDNIADLFLNTRSIDDIADLFLKISFLSRGMHRACAYHVRNVPLELNVVDTGYWDDRYYDLLLAWVKKNRPKLSTFEMHVDVNEWQHAMIYANIAKCCDISTLRYVNLDNYGKASRDERKYWHRVQIELSFLFADQPVIQQLKLGFHCGLMNLGLLTNSSQVEIMELQTAKYNDAQGISDAIESMPCLRDLNIKGILSEGLCIKSRTLQDINVVRISNIDLELAELICPLMRKLDFSGGSTGNFDPSILAGGCQCLETLGIEVGWRCYALGRLGGGQEMLNTLSNVIEHMPMLKNLRFRKDHVGGELTLRSRSLETIDLSGCNPTFRIVECRCPMLSLFQCDYNRTIFWRVSWSPPHGILRIHPEDLKIVSKGGLIDFTAGGQVGSGVLKDVPEACIVRVRKISQR